MTREELYRRLAELCGEYGFVTDYTHELLESVVDSLVKEDALPPRGGRGVTTE